MSRSADHRQRARFSHGASSEAVYRLVAAALAARGLADLTLLDVGCGNGELRRHLDDRVRRYVGADVIRYAGLPGDAEFVEIDLEHGRLPLADDFADVVACVETIEHVENPRALCRELVRLTRPGGHVAITTPNQLSLASKLCLVTRGQFLHFQERPGLYPAHITALLEIDLRRIAHEVGLEDVEVLYSASGRVPFTARHWPPWLRGRSGFRGAAFSDNLLLIARKP